MLYTAPDPLPALFSRPSVFIAGGISNCPDWQSTLAHSLDTQLYDVVNPRRNTGFDRTGNTAGEQIAWEHSALAKVDSCVFWFPCETLCPITLFELGKLLVRASQKSVRLVVGWHPDYQRAFDLQVQIALEHIPLSHMMHAAPGWDEFVNVVAQHWGHKSKDTK